MFIMKKATQIVLTPISKKLACFETSNSTQLQIPNKIILHI